jgi:hypothetical protein
MTQTVQSCSCAYSNETQINLNKSEIENSMRLLFSLSDSMNTLCESLSRLNYLLKTKNIEQILYKKGEIK